MSKRPIGRSKTRWKDEGLEDVQGINVRNQKKVAQNRDTWKKVVERARTLYRLKRFIRRRRRRVQDLFFLLVQYLKYFVHNMEKRFESCGYILQFPAL